MIQTCSLNLEIRYFAPNILVKFKDGCLESPTKKGTSDLGRTFLDIAFSVKLGQNIGIHHFK